MDFYRIRSMQDMKYHKIKKLIEKGVVIPNPESVAIGDEVDPDRISSKDVTIHTGCKISGKSTLILQGAKIGKEAPATISNCQVGPFVELKGGFFDEAVFLEGSSAGSGSHVRGGTIFEEQANIAHTVGLKQTLLFPFVTLGSLINFCDCFMAGGTDRKNHSEVGSSYIHFNYTPNQDKATASLIGDVPNGVFLNRNPIFLGGQGGLVGPCRITYGTVIAAGSVYRKDQLKPDRLVFEGRSRGGSIPTTPGIYRNVKRQTINNFNYIANLIALMQWYRHVRSMCISNDFPQPLYEGLIDKLNMAVSERIKRFKAFCHKMSFSAEKYKSLLGKKASGPLLTQKYELYENQDNFENLFFDLLNKDWKNDPATRFLDIVNTSIKSNGKNYIKMIQSLETDVIDQGASWLQHIVDQVQEKAIDLLPSFKS